MIEGRIVKGIALIYIMSFASVSSGFGQEDQFEKNIHRADSICKINATSFTKSQIGEKQFNKYLKLSKCYLESSANIVIFTIQTKHCRNGCCVLPIYLNSLFKVDTVLSKFKLSQIRKCKKNNYTSKHYMTEEDAFQIAKKNAPELGNIKYTSALYSNGTNGEYVFTIIYNEAGGKSVRVNAISGNVEIDGLQTIP